MFSRVTSLPLYRICPPVLSFKWISVRPRVDLPHPDSPTSPTVSPFSMVKDTSSTAWTMPAALLKYFFRFFTSINAAMAYSSVLQHLEKCPGLISSISRS